MLTLIAAFSLASCLVAGFLVAIEKDEDE